MPAAWGSFLASTAASLAYAIWVASQGSVPPEVELAAAYFPMWCFFGTPVSSAFSALAGIVADRVFREFQARPLPRGIPFVLGALIGLLFSLGSASLFIPIACAPPGPC
jgi:hypothetical protein